MLGAQTTEVLKRLLNFSPEQLRQAAESGAWARAPSASRRRREGHELWRVTSRQQTLNPSLFASARLSAWVHMPLSTSCSNYRTGSAEAPYKPKVLIFGVCRLCVVPYLYSPSGQS